MRIVIALQPRRILEIEPITWLLESRPQAGPLGESRGRKDPAPIIAGTSRD
jgi:hypothetical protein